MPVKAGQIDIEIRASAERLRSDMDGAVKQIRRLGEGGLEAGREMSKGMEAAALSVAKVSTEAAIAVEGTLLAGAKYAAVNAANTTSTEGFLASLRALRIAASAAFPATFGSVAFASTTVAMGILAEETAKLVIARAKLIEQQSLIAAKSGAPLSQVETLSTISSIAGGNASAVLGLGKTPQELTEIAAKFEAISNPAERASLAVQIFGSNAGAALQELNAKFVAASEVYQRFGLGINDISRTQIVQFRKDISGLGGTFTAAAEEWRAAGESFKQPIAEMTGAADGLAHRLDAGLGSGGNTFLQNLLGHRPQGPSPLTSGELNGANARKNSIGTGIVADELFAQAQGAHFRQSQTLAGQQTEQSAAKSRADAAYGKLNDGTKRGPEERFGLVQEQQSPAALAAAIGVRIKGMQDAAEAEEKLKAAAEQLAEFQGKAGERLKALAEQINSAAFTTPVGSYLNLANIEIGRDSDKTTGAEKQGRAAIELQGLRQLMAAESAKWATGFVADLNRSAALMSPKLKGVDIPSKEGSRDQVRKDDEDELRVRDAGERSARMATIQSQPGDEVALAQRVLDIRLQTVTAEWAILNANQQNYDLEDLTLSRKKLETEESNAQLTYENAIAEIEKSREQSALAAGGGYQLQLRAITQQLDALNKIKVTDQNITDIELARVALAQKAAEIEIQRLLALGTLKAGWDAFWIEMQEQAEKPGEILFDGMNSALDKTSSNLAKLVTGQHKKTTFGKDLESVGQSMVQSSMKAMLQKSLGALGKKLGIKPPTGKPDGTPMNPYYVVMQGAAAGAKATDPTAGATGAVAKGALGALGGALGGLLGKLGGLFGGGGGTAVSSSISFMAGGGDADPGRVYGVAEAGEAELISPKNSSRITPLSKLGGNTHTYNIDARGADLGAENRVARAIEFAHNSAVSSSVRANSERAKRTPKRSA